MHCKLFRYVPILFPLITSNHFPILACHVPFVYIEISAVVLKAVGTGCLRELSHSHWISGVSMPMHAQRDIVMANLSVCLSHAGIVSKRMHISSNSFHRLVGQLYK